MGVEKCRRCEWQGMFQRKKMKAPVHNLSKMFHATCHADAAAGTSTLLTRIKQQTGSRSRSATPEFSTPVEHKSSVRLAEYTHGSTKRKALEFDNDDDPSSPAREGTPPSKKIAISDDHRGHVV